MARSLYRLYLYAIFIALTIFAVISTAQLLSTLFALTPLRGQYDSPPDQTALIQALVFAIVGWIISGTLGGLHYWLIRRDQSSDPAAGASPIRAFFLNITEAGGVLTVVSLVGFSLIGNWAYNSGYDVSWSAGAALPTLAMVVLLELERRRFQARKGAALVFQRLHFFGVQLILLFLLAGSFLSAFRPLIDGLFFKGRDVCSGGYCPAYNLLGLGSMLLWFIACWLIYGLATHQDTSRVTRLIMHGASLAFGIGFILGSVFVALELALRPMFNISVGLSDVLGYNASYDFASPLVLGILVTIIYHLLLRDVSQRGMIKQQTRRLTGWAIATVLLAGAFWWGCAYALYDFLQAIAPSPTGPDNPAWITAIALVITGLAYIPLDFYIRRRFTLDPTATMGPRRGLVLVLLGASILALAIGGAMALYASLTALLGSPLSNWPQIAHAGLAAVIVGAIVAGTYLWSTRGEHLFTRQPGSQPPTLAAPLTSTTTIENILDKLLAGKISREEAAIQIRALSIKPVPVPV